MCVVLQVGLEGVLLSSCSAAGMWRVRDLAGLGRDDLFSGLRYALSCMDTHRHKLNHMSSVVAVIATYLTFSHTAIPSFSLLSLYLLCPFV